MRRIRLGDAVAVCVLVVGGRGFGIRKQETTGDHWIEEFYWWLEGRGFTKASK